MNKLNEKTIEQIAEYYNTHNEFDGNENENMNFNPEFKVRTTEIFQKFHPSFEDCKRIDEKIDSWNNRDIEMTSTFFRFCDYTFSEKFCKEHVEDIKQAIWDYMAHDDGIMTDYMYASQIYNTYKKYLNKKELIDWLEKEGFDRETINYYI